MTLRTLLATALLVPATAVFAADGTFDKTLTLEGAPSVTVRTGAGYVHVYSGPDSRVHITGHVHARPGLFSSDADARVQQILASPPIVQTGNIVLIGPAHEDSDLYRNISIDYDVLTPSSTTLKAQSGSGNLEIGGIAGEVIGQSGSGEIHADNIGANARLETGSGAIRATNVHGAANLQTGSGSIDLALTAPGDVRAQTGSGGIHIDGVSGSLHAGTGSGSIEVAGNPTSDWRVNSGSGSIRMKLSDDAHFTLNADTGSGEIRVDRPIVMQGALNRHHVSGTVNGGGPTIRASTGSGEVTIR
jgi:hypothetical protein